MSRKIIILIVAIIAILLVVISVLVNQYLGNRNAQNQSQVSSVASSSVEIVERITGFPREQIIPDIPKQIEEIKNLPPMDLSPSSVVSISSSSNTINSSQISSVIPQLTDNQLQQLKRYELTTFNSGSKLVRLPTNFVFTKDTGQIDGGTLLPKPIFGFSTKASNPDQFYILTNNQLKLLSNNIESIYEFKFRDKNYYFFVPTYDNGDISMQYTDDTFSFKKEIKPIIKGFVSNVKVENKDFTRIKITNYPGDGGLEKDFKQETIDFNLIKYLEGENK